MTPTPTPDIWDSISKSLTIFSGIATSLVAVIAALSAIFKPVRTGISWLLKRIYKTRDKQQEIMDKISSIETNLSKEIEGVSLKVDRVEINNIRRAVFAFASQCRQGMRHSRESYADIFRMTEDYKVLLERTEMTNSVFEMDLEYIKRCYQRDLEDNNFDS